MLNTERKNYGVFSLPVIVAGLGYFVDLYDLLLFSAVRIPSLRDIGVPEADLFAVGVRLINIQVLGLIAGGLLFGMLGDKFGRMRLMFISIITYSLATLGCAFVNSAPLYAALRFVTGLGMAGEVGLAVTLIAEIMPKEKRGYATAVVATLGVLGAVAAAMLAQFLPWQTCYLIGGVLGLLIFLLRSMVIESFIFAQQRREAEKGSLMLLLRDGARLRKFLQLILIGTPIYCTSVFFGTFAPEITHSLGLTEPFTAAMGVAYVYIGLTVGDAASGALSQYWRSRRAAAALFMAMGIVAVGTLLLLPQPDSFWVFQAYYLVIGFASGYWIVMCTMAAESFGTNLRATVASTVPNFVRASLLPINLAIAALKPEFGLIGSILIVCSVSYGLALISLAGLKETCNTDLNYEER